MTRAWDAWVALWDRKEPATALALVRILLGFALLVDLLNLARLGVVDGMFSLPPDGFAVPYDGWSVRLLGADAGPTLYVVAVIAAACVTFGLATRVACVVLVLATAQLGWMAPGADRGIHMIARVVLCILALSGSHARWSIDAWVWAKLGRPLPREVAAWPRYLLLAQLLWIYAAGGLNKSGGEWGPQGGFLALANALTDPHFARFDPAWVSTALPITRVATALTMVFELSAPLYLVWLYCAETAERPGRARALVNKLRLRWIWIALGLSFQLGIATLMTIGMFPWGMLTLYPVLLRPSELRRFG